MALIDVKEYYYKVLNNYLTAKEDLADFEIAFRESQVTEDQLTEVKEDLNKLKENLDRISFIMYLFNLPHKKKKRLKYRLQSTNSNLEQYFHDQNADLESVLEEDDFVLQHLQKSLKQLSKDK